jgi:hypothetical protein
MPTYTVNLPTTPISQGIGYIVGTQLSYDAPINRTPAVGGTINTPLVARGNVQINYLSKKTPAAAASFTNLAMGSLVVGPITIDDDCALTGGQLGVQDIGDGGRSLLYTAIYTFFAHAT